jgi:hypothetical protein
MRDLYHNINIKPIIPLQPLQPGQTITGFPISLKGVGSSLLLISVGEPRNDFNEDSGASFHLEQEGEEGGFHPVSPTHVIGGPVKEEGEILCLDHADKTNRLYRFMYRGGASALRLKIKSKGDFEQGTIVGAFHLAGGLSYVPVAD